MFSVVGYESHPFLLLQESIDMTTTTRPRTHATIRMGAQTISLPLTFADAEQLCGNRNGRKLELNTYLERIDPDTFGVRLHNTYVVEIHRDGTYTLDSGGWYTVTTKDRINRYSPARVYQRNFGWYFAQAGDGRVEFENGIRVDASGLPVKAV